MVLEIYRRFFGIWFGGACRFEPSCSNYAHQALKEHELFTALLLVAKRLARCRPGGGFGYDPIPGPNFMAPNQLVTTPKENQ